MKRNAPFGASPLQQYYGFITIVLVCGVGLLAVIACWLRRNCRHGGRYEYTALEAENHGAGGGEKLEMGRRPRAGPHSACTRYLATSSRYSLQYHLNDIGSRVEKQWFVVWDSKMKAERLMSVVSKPGKCPQSSTRDAALDLLLSLQHPYIYPVLDLAFTTDNQGQAYILTIIPYNDKGSLKDLIYKSVWREDWIDKYRELGEGLSIQQVRRLGRQILEALLFLKERGFPSSTHLHSGNIILQNGVARLSGLENVLFGAKSRIHSTVAPSCSGPSDILCFGHVLWEMCAGYELTEPAPSQTHLENLTEYPQVVELLEQIFNHDDEKHPTVEDLLLSDFFRTIDLREMRATSLPQVYHATLSSSTLALLNDLHRSQNSQSEKESSGSSSGDESSAASYQPTLVEHRNLSLHLNGSVASLLSEDVVTR